MTIAFANSVQDLLIENLQHVIQNLGDEQAKTRKLSHNCLLAFLKTYENLDPILEAYLKFGFSSPKWIIR